LQAHASSSSSAGGAAAAGGGGGGGAGGGGRGRGNGPSDPSFALGFPSFHGTTGNLPVLASSAHLHKPLTGERQSDARSEYRAMTGNLPVLSTELQQSGGAADLFPGWVSLVDPVSRRTFWWNVLHRSRREAQPQPDDDGREGAGRGEPDASGAARRNARLAAVLESRTWVELFSAEHSRLFYWNKRAGTTQWRRPEKFYEDGVSYKGRWVEVLDPGGGSMYRDRHTGNVFHDMCVRRRRR